MVAEQIAARGVRDERVLRALRKVPRHRFVPDAESELAYADHPLPIGCDQTISQPYIVAFMSAMLELGGDEKVLEIGTGSGYQTAVLAELAARVYTIEIVEVLAARAQEVLAAGGYTNVRVRVGDGHRGWPEEAPFDAIVVSAAADHVPPALLEQLAVGGRMVLPVGDSRQSLARIRRTPDGHEREELIPVRFVPMTGEARD